MFKTNVVNLDRSRLENTNFSIIFDQEHSETDEPKTNEVVIADDFPPIDFLCSSGTNKSVLLFMNRSNRFSASNEKTYLEMKKTYLEMKKKCKKTFKGLSINIKDVTYDHYLRMSHDREKHFIGDVINTACFEEGTLISHRFF